MKRVLITGAASGMGLSASHLFADRGWIVMMADLNDTEGRARCTELLEEGLQNIHFHPCDVSDSASVKALHEQTMASLGGIDSIINNAGIWRGGELHNTSEEDWDTLFAVDVKSIFLTSKYFVPSMIANGGGTIVNTASVSGLNGDYNMAAYNAAKGAVVNLTRAMALDYGKYNIRVNNVCPSACATPMFLANPTDVVDQFNQATPLGRICTPQEVAEAMYFLASDASRSCNGVNLPVSGGLELHTGQPVQ
ncbi:SDR family oxidoreductase [Salinisphaera sp. G21_0]|uniref:SDR family NAD(P)-dependent oxidoreductase n=1 Tax=Salinisphaera sp. G21_0 TaxID=2821094 RepID=UPI001ADBB35C|nr:SDR family oxidoreductase [Salinisphaera sp. G21_0]MBO9481074.1 SDR family oxidoreductase [Salinisphaera sp. G21_0]